MPHQSKRGKGEEQKTPRPPALSTVGDLSRKKKTTEKHKKKLKRNVISEANKECITLDIVPII